MNEEYLEDALASYLAGFLTAEGVPANVIAEDLELTEGSLPIVKAGIPVELDEAHVLVTCRESNAAPQYRGSQEVACIVAWVDPIEVGRSQHMTNARLLRKALVRTESEIENTVNAQDIGIRLQRFEFQGVSRGMDQGKLTTGITFSGLTSLTS